MTVMSPVTEALMDSSHFQSVLGCLNDQRTQGMFCDVTIVVEDIKFKAHKNVLAASSFYFKNAFSSQEFWVSGQVLELPDFKSEVFAGILNFIYSAKLASTVIEDVKLFVAAGKKLGIPFLENLAELERRSSSVSQIPSQPPPFQTASPDSTLLPADSHSLKRETPNSSCDPRTEETECTSGPRITNAFSIIEAGPNNDLFSPLDLRASTKRSQEPEQLPVGCPGQNAAVPDSEQTHTLSEHSYAVNQSRKTTEQDELGANNGRKESVEPTDALAKPQMSLSCSPLKKRHKLRANLVKNTLAQSRDGTQAPLNTTTAATVTTSSENQNDAAAPQMSTDHSLAPYRCEYCPETFSNKAILHIHTQVHKRRFVSHLACKFCRKKFMHLKRLRNHEQICNKALTAADDLEPGCGEPQTDTSADHMSSPHDSTLPTCPQDLPDSSPHSDFPMDTSETLPEPESGQRVVSGQRVYLCAVCKRSYVTLSSLRRHENVHSWQRTYPCHYCNKVFALAEYRTKHEIWHTGERRYQCIFCLETFMTYYILKNHQKAFHGIDPRLAVNKKSASGGFKSSIYPIKLYRLLPMKFRKRQYKTYSQNGSCMGQPLFSMPVTFMATPKVIASVTPHITFDQPCHADVTQPLSSEADMCRQKELKSISQDTEALADPLSSNNKGSSVISYGYTHPVPSVIMQSSRVSSVIVHGNDMGSIGVHNNDNEGSCLPFLEINTDGFSETKGNDKGHARASYRREELSRVQGTETTGSQAYLSGYGSASDRGARIHCTGSKTETYIAKPACPGPSVNNQVPPLCQITVKIGDEAIIRRRIKGSKLFQRKIKKCRWSPVTEEAEGTVTEPKERNTNSVCLRSRTEVTSVIEAETYDDVPDRDTGDKLWRPYYSYKPKKKPKGGNKMRSKHRRKGKRGRAPGKPLRSNEIAKEPEFTEDYLSTSYSMHGKVISDVTRIGRQLRKSVHKEPSSCDICQSLFSSSSALKMHMISCHPDGRPSVCKTCGKQSPPNEVTNANYPFPDDEREFVCKNCIEDGSCFNNSFTSHKTEKRYRCSFCPQRFLYLATKKSHEKKHLEKYGKGYNCYYCQKVCKSSAALAIHQKKHVIKTEDDNDGDDKESARLLCGISNVTGELDTGESEHTDADTAVTTKLEDQSEISSSNGYFQDFKGPDIKTLISSPHRDTLSFPGSPTQLPPAKAWNSYPSYQERMSGQCPESCAEQRQKYSFMSGQVYSDYCLPPVLCKNNEHNSEQLSPIHGTTNILSGSTQADFPKAEYKQPCKEETS
ncbi:ZBT38 protein, partial [Amia calva]|nr:ZBT38 protein [Amia calva]